LNLVPVGGKGRDPSFKKQQKKRGKEIESQFLKGRKTKKKKQWGYFGTAARKKRGKNFGEERTTVGTKTPFGNPGAKMWVTGMAKKRTKSFTRRGVNNTKN